RSRTPRRGIRVRRWWRSRLRAGRPGSPSHHGAVGPPGWICRRRRTRRGRSAAASPSVSVTVRGPPRCSVVVSASELLVLLSVFHGPARDPVVGTFGSAYGHGARGHLGGDRVVIGRLRVDGAGAGHIADGEVEHGPSDQGLVLA